MPNPAKQVGTGAIVSILLAAFVVATGYGVILPVLPLLLERIAVDAIVSERHEPARGESPHRGCRHAPIGQLTKRHPSGRAREQPQRLHLPSATVAHASVRTTVAQLFRAAFAGRAEALRYRGRILRRGCRRGRAEALRYRFGIVGRRD